MRKSKIFLFVLHIIIFIISFIGILHCICNDSLILGLISLLVIMTNGICSFINMHEKMLREVGMIE